VNRWSVQRTVRASDGRTLAVEEAGDPHGHPVLVHFGMPNSRHLYSREVADAVNRGLRLIGYDRPGYGGSVPHPGRAVADCAADVRAICETLGISRLTMWGGSGGGPHVLACAALLPDLVTAVAVLASVAPFPADGLDWFTGIGEGNGAGFRLALTDPDAARAGLEKQRAEALAASPDTIVEQFKSELSPAEAAALSDELARYVALVLQDGLAPGIDGLWEDTLAFLSPWGFDLASISVPVLLLHGQHDRSVPITHGQWLSARIPGVETRFLDNDGHLTLLEDRMGEVHAWLADHI
jgi:pimeloyl-ACP methyl ester carboxylesterase